MYPSNGSMTIVICISLEFSGILWEKMTDFWNNWLGVVIPLPYILGWMAQNDIGLQICELLMELKT